jgi:hypothetical protein
MAISVLDVRSTFVPPRLVLPSRATVRTAAPAAPRRLPLTVMAAAALGVTEALGLLAVGLTGLDSLLTAATRPHGGIVGAVVLLLATWVVVSAGSGAALVDGTGRRGFVAVAYAELFAVAVVGIAAVAVPLPVPTAGLPLPAVVLLALAVPVAKLLLAGTSSVQAWIAAGPRVRSSRPDPVAKHRMVATLTMAVIGLGLGAVAVGGPQQDGPGGIGTTVTSVVADR